jgi:hypothetical protein
VFAKNLIDGVYALILTFDVIDVTVSVTVIEVIVNLSYKKNVLTCAT